MPAPTPTPTDSYPSEDHTAPRLTSRAASEPRIHGAADARAEPADASSVATLPWPGRWSAEVLAAAEAQVPLSEAELAAMDAAGDGEPRRADVRPDAGLSFVNPQGRTDPFWNDNAVRCRHDFHKDPVCTVGLNIIIERRYTKNTGADHRRQQCWLLASNEHPRQTHAIVSVLISVKYRTYY